MTELLEAVSALADDVRRQAEQIEVARHLPERLIAQIRKAGIFRMLLPAQYGGLEIDFPTTVDVLRTIAKADGSTGWSLMIGCETPQLLALLPRDLFTALYADGPDVVIGGAFAPKGSATRENGGYRVSGQWGFASGCEHADWLFGNAVVADPDAPDAAPELRCMMLPRCDWRILDTWHTVGMRGTGSHDIVLEDAYVEDAFTFDLFGGKPQVPGALFAAPLLQFSLHIGAVALGIAEGALDDLVTLAGTGKTRLYGRNRLADGQLFQYRLGHADADARAARASLDTQAAGYWRAALDRDVPEALRIDVLQTVAWVVETSTRIVDVCHTAAGGTSVYVSSPLQRRLRDIHTLTQHASVQESVFADAGAARLGGGQPLGL